MMSDEKEPSLDHLYDSGATEPEPSTQETRYVCSSCGERFAVGQKLKFCSQCGARISEVSNTVEVDTSAKTRVLLADDSALARKKVGGILQNLNCEVSEAEDGTTALSLAVSVRPQLVVLDVHMPGGNGLQVLKALRENQFFATIPIVMMTGEADAAVVSQAIALKATDYVRKDDSVETITARLQSHLDKLRQ